MQRWNVCVEGGDCSRNWKLSKSREEVLAGLENNLAVFAEFLGMRWFCQSCLCAHQGLVLCTWMSSLTVGLDQGSHCTAPLILWLSPQYLLGPVQEAVTALRDHEDRTVAQECPIFHFVKVKQHSALMTDPNSPFRTTFSRALSGTRSFLLAALAALRCCWGCCCFIPLWLRDRSHQYCRLAYRAVKGEMGIFTLVSHSCYFQLQMENRMSTVMMLCHCLGQWISAVCSCRSSCSWVAMPGVCSRAGIMGIKPLL